MSSGGHFPAIASRIRDAVIRSIPVYAEQALENCTSIRAQLALDSPDSDDMASPSVLEWDKLCASLPFRKLARISYEEAYAMIEDSRNQDNDSAVAFSPSVESQAPFGGSGGGGSGILSYLRKQGTLAARKYRLTLKPMAMEYTYGTASLPLQVAESAVTSTYSSANYVAEVAISSASSVANLPAKAVNRVQQAGAGLAASVWSSTESVAQSAVEFVPSFLQGPVNAFFR